MDLDSKEFIQPSMYTVVADWNDAPHLTDQMKRVYLATLSPHQRYSRTKGLPLLGSGAVYPVEEDILGVDDFKIPLHWKFIYGFDTGWHYNGVVFGALDPVNDILYIFRTIKLGAVEPSVVAAAIKRQGGSWMPGIADAADINKDDGKKTLWMYNKLGLKLQLPNKAIETGISEVWTRMKHGRFKVFRSCTDWFEEFRLFSRNKDGKLPKQDQHRRRELMDSTRYMVMSIEKAILKPEIKQNSAFTPPGFGAEHGWMGA